MSEPSPPQSGSQSFWKLIAFALMFALVGVYILYDWYDDRLKAQIAEKDSLVVQLSDRVKETEARRLAAEEGWNASRAEIEALKERFQTEKRDLNDQIHMLEEIKVGLGQDMEGIKAAHAAVLADERQKTAQAVAEQQRLAAARDEVQARLEAEREKVQALKADLGRVNDAIAESATSHQQRIAELERHLNERVSLARTTPADAELLRTVQELGLLGTPEGRTAEAQALADDLAKARAEFETLYKEHEATRARLAESQTELQKVRMDLELSHREAAQSEQAREALARVAALEAELDAEREARAALEQQQANALAAHEAALTELQTALEQARAEAGDEAQEAEKLAAAEARIRELEADLEAARAEVEDSRASLNEALEQARARLAELQQAAEAAAQDENEALTEAQARIASLEAELEQVRTADQSESEALTEARARIESLTAELEQARAQDGADETLNEARARIQALETELETARQSLQSETPSADQSQAAAELARLRALHTSFAQLNGAFTERGLLLSLAESELSFPTGQATLPAGELASLDRIAALLKAHPELTARIEGHTDSLGSAALNQSLSLQRAEAVRQALVERGVDEGRLSAEGLGPERPIADNATAEGRGKNRRVEVYILDRD
ncbi:OmpA family protein [Allochromatium humboldtianum]|uniref:OmpA family protein n=1 Tax=Allochromatium humboldtianum TaxID=504901 RepID=A0A850RDS3_9GAMM|nr:OmpA family protein [Allochromatium humboldtianum]NVZ11075.1 OmpA family protein [Allochromatium humboldtianum]